MTGCNHVKNKIHWIVKIHHYINRNFFYKKTNLLLRLIYLLIWTNKESRYWKSKLTDEDSIRRREKFAMVFGTAIQVDTEIFFWSVVGGSKYICCWAFVNCISKSVNEKNCVRWERFWEDRSIRLSSIWIKMIMAKTMFIHYDKISTWAVGYISSSRISRRFSEWAWHTRCRHLVTLVKGPGT